MEKISLRKALIKFYNGTGCFTLEDVIENKELLLHLKCSTPLTRNRVRDEVTGMIREKTVEGKIVKKGGDTYYQFDGLPRAQTARPQFSKVMCIALGLPIPQ